MPKSPLDSAQATLATLGRTPDARLDPFDGALALSHWNDPYTAPAPYRRHAHALIEAAQAYVGADPLTVTLGAEAARQVLARRFGYGGSDDPADQADDADLARVIDRRRGGAPALCLLYAHVLRGLGLICEVLDFSPRPLVRLEDDTGARLVIDPFASGHVRDARALRQIYRDGRGGEGDLDPFTIPVLGTRRLLIRLQDQVKAFHLRHAAPEAALAALEGAVLLAPNEARLWWEAALLHERLDHTVEAIAALQCFLQLPGADERRYTASQLLQQLQRGEGKDTS